MLFALIKTFFNFWLTFISNNVFTRLLYKGRFYLVDWLVLLGFNATLTAKVTSWRSVTHICFRAWLSHASTNTTFFPRPTTTFLTCFSRGERRKYAEKKFRLNWVSNSQPPGHESDTLTTGPPGRGRAGLFQRSLFAK